MTEQVFFFNNCLSVNTFQVLKSHVVQDILSKLELAPTETCMGYPATARE